MKIIDFLSKESVVIGLKGKNKKEVKTELVERLVASGKIKKDKSSKVVKALLEREGLGSTGIGQGIAIPHAKSENISEIICAFGSSAQGVDFDALDGELVYIIFLLIAPYDSAGLHLKALAKISRFLKDKFFRQVLKEAKEPKEIIKVIRDEDEY